MIALIKNIIFETFNGKKYMGKISIEEMNKFNEDFTGRVENIRQDSIFLEDVSMVIIKWSNTEDIILTIKEYNIDKTGFFLKLGKRRLE